jgi:cytochrome c
MKNSWKLLICLSILSCLGFAQAMDLGTYKGCPASDADFKETRIYNGNNALKMAFDLQDDGSTDVYFIRRMGEVFRFSSKTGQSAKVGTIPVTMTEEYGLVGIAVDPDFKKNGSLFFIYFFTEPGNKSGFRISRINLDAARSQLDLGSEKILIRFSAEAEHWHSGGAMAFDAYGDLYITIGDNEKIEEGPGNTADFRGGILRIHPDGSVKGYSIPTGNFGERFSAVFRAQGNLPQAILYADTVKVKPEIYVKGTRNAYTLTLDPVRRWLTWGDVGPDQGKVSEEYNLVHQSEYMGWPYFAGEETMAGVKIYHGAIPSGSTRAAPINNLAMAGTVNGAKALPPLREPTFTRIEGCAMTGPIFRYDGRLKSSGNFPPQLNRKWMISGCDGYGFHILNLDSAGEKVNSKVEVFASINPNTLVDLQQGPDGSVYYVSYITGVYRVDYTGTCKDPALVPEKTGCTDPVASNFDPAIPKAYHDPRLCVSGTRIALATRGSTPGDFHLTEKILSIRSPGPHQVDIIGVDGRLQFSFHGVGACIYPLPLSLLPGIYQLRLSNSAGSRTVLFFHGL